VVIIITHWAGEALFLNDGLAVYLGKYAKFEFDPSRKSYISYIFY